LLDIFLYQQEESGEWMEDSRTKRTYGTPKLQTYGDIQQITGAVDNVSKVADGGTGKTNKST
jgi:hypothetical protein